jgi:cytochrome b pre-mRNA-processing protein 3
MPIVFKALRPAAPPSAPAYDAAVNAARDPAFYRGGAVPDTMDGRFAMLATVVALVELRLETDGDEGRAPSVALTEAFITDMDVQMREQGFDATLSKQVRSLVGSLASRVDRWRTLLATSGDWDEAVRASVYRNDPVADAALAATTGKLRQLVASLAAAPLDRVVAGAWAGVGA